MASSVMDQPTLKQRKGNVHVSGMLHDSSSTIMLDVRAGGQGVGFFGYRPPPFYSSLPSSAATKQPPLLPLPFSISASFPSPSRRVAAEAAAAGPGATRRARQHKKNPRSSRKETILLADTARFETKPVGKTDIEAKLGETEGDEEEVFLGGGMYISPPPSSLPLPRFCLMSPSTTAMAAAAPNCNAKAVAGGGGGVAAVATDDLRRLLRI